VFVLDDLHRSKFNLVAVNRLPTVLDRSDLEALFAEMTPRFYSIDALEQHIFAPNQGGIVIAVVEKEKAI
jgi:hypothetical protein